MSLRFFFLLALSSPTALRFFNPFSSPGTEPDSRRVAKKAGLGFLKVYNATKGRVRKGVIETMWVESAYNDVFGLVSLLQEVEVMVDEVGFVGGKLDLHVKLTPSLLLDTEGRVLESWIRDILSASGLLSRRALVEQGPHEFREPRKTYFAQRESRNLGEGGM